MIASLAIAGSLVLAFVPRTTSDELIPGGTINGALGYARKVIVYDDHDAVATQARWLQSTFFKEAQLVSSDEAVDRDLEGANLIVYGSPETSALLRLYEDALPFAFDDTGVTLHGKHYDAARPRVITALVHPEDRSRRMLVYAARDPKDIQGVNGVFHGPTEWLVADGDRTLASGSYVVTKPLSVEDMRADLDALAATIEEVHPAAAEGLPADVEQAIAEATAGVSEPMSRQAFWGVLNRVIAGLHDAHSTIGPLRSGVGIALPLAWLEEGLFVSLSAGKLERGDRVLAIGGVDVPTLEKELIALLPAENRWWVRYQACSLLADSEFLRRLGVEVGEGVTVRIERGGNERSVTLPLGGALPVEEARRWVFFKLEKEHDLAVFTLDTCVINDEYRRVVREFFQAVHEGGIGRIAIDVRQNQGGNSRVVDEFLRYLDVETYRSYSGQVRWSEPSRELVGADVPLGMAEIPSGPRANDRVTDVPLFSGELYVLTSNATFSSGSWFAVVLSDNGLAQVVGEPTGNAPSSYGDLLRRQLPRTGFGYSLSFKRWRRPDPSRDPVDTLALDHHVPRTRQDLIEGNDPVLRFVRAR